MASTSQTPPQSPPAHVEEQHVATPSPPPSPIKSSKVSFALEDIRIKACNFLGISELPSKKKYHPEEYKPMFDFIQSSVIGEAIHKDPVTLQVELLEEFWWTAEYVEDDNENYIVGTVLNGSQKIKITRNRIRQVLRLPKINSKRPFVEPPTTSEWKAWLPTIGYQYAIIESERKEVPINPRKNLLPGVWAFLLTHIIQCMFGNTGSHDQANSSQMQMFMSLAEGINIDYALMIYEDLATKVKKNGRPSVIPYTRTIALVMQHILGERYTSATHQTPSRIGVSIFAADAKAEVAPLTVHMKKVLSISFPDTYPKIPADTTSSQKNEKGASARKDKRKQKGQRSLTTPTATSNTPITPPKGLTHALSSTTKTILGVLKKGPHFIQKGNY